MKEALDFFGRIEKLKKGILRKFKKLKIKNLQEIYFSSTSNQIVSVSNVSFANKRDRGSFRSLVTWLVTDS